MSTRIKEKTIKYYSYEEATEILTKALENCAYLHDDCDDCSVMAECRCKWDKFADRYENQSIPEHEIKNYLETLNFQAKFALTTSNK